MKRIAQTLCLAALMGWLLAGCGVQDRSLAGKWRFAVDSRNVGEADAWFADTVDRSGWQEAEVPASWDGLGLEAYDGVGWYAREFSLDDPEAQTLVFQGVDDDATVWINGIGVGSHKGYSEPFTIDIPESLRTPAMQVVVRVFDEAGPGGIIGDIAAVPTNRVEEYMRSPLAAEKPRTSAGWVQSAVVYEVYLRSFSKEGTLQALAQRLPELRDLGVTVLWLMPIHPIGELNRKGSLGSPYAVMDFRDVNPEFGTLDDARTLVTAAHEHGMKIIIDLVANHTSWDNEMLIRHPEWYTRDDEGAIISPNDDWHDVADLNYDRHELRKYMINVMRFWVEEVGIDGFRCDVADLVPLDFWTFARHELDGIKDVMMLAESSSPEHHLEAFDVTYAWSTYDLLDPLFDGEVGATAITHALKSESLRFPEGSLLLRFHTNHDKNAWDGPAVAKWGADGMLLAATTMYLLPGIPLLYNGEEVGNSTVLPLFEKVPIDWTDGERFRVHFEKLGALRRDHPWLSTGGWREIPQSANAQALILMRTDAVTGDAVLGALNFSSSRTELDIPMPEEFEDKALVDVFTSSQIPPADRLMVILPPRGFSILTSAGQ